MLRPGCCSYTVRCYDSDGLTLWIQDYFRGAHPGEWVDGDLSCCAIGDYVFVGGPRVVGSSTWNLCRYDASSGHLVDRWDLGSVAGSIEDVAAGEDGSLAILIGDHGNSYDPDTMSDVDGAAFTNTPYPANYQRISVSAAGDFQPAGESDGTTAIVWDGTDQYRCGGFFTLTFDAGDVQFPAWGFVWKTPGSTLFGTLIQFSNVQPSTFDWFSMAVRKDTGVSPPALSNDPRNRLNDLALIRDGSGTATGIVTIGKTTSGADGLFRGSVASADIGDPFYSPVYMTSGSLAESGSVGRFSMAGDFARAYSPAVTTALTRVSAVPGAGYYLGGSAVSGGSLFARDSSDAKLWTHKHQSVTGMVSTPSGGCVTVGERSRRVDDASFL